MADKAPTITTRALPITIEGRGNLLARRLAYEYGGEGHDLDLNPAHIWRLEDVVAVLDAIDTTAMAKAGLRGLRNLPPDFPVILDAGTERERRTTLKAFFDDNDFDLPEFTLICAVLGDGRGYSGGGGAEGEWSIHPGPAPAEPPPSTEPPAADKPTETASPTEPPAAA